MRQFHFMEFVVNRMDLFLFQLIPVCLFILLHLDAVSISVWLRLSHSLNFISFSHHINSFYHFDVHIFSLSFSNILSKFRAILRRGFAFSASFNRSASIRNPPLLKSRNIQSQTSITANVPVQLIGGAQPVITTPQTSETAVQIKDTSKLQYHTSITGPKHTQVQQKLSNESIDLSCSNQNPHAKNEHIV